ncbi:MAG: hypothetical protein ACFB51_08905, partial [Anaerolineae bacterium]
MIRSVVRSFVVGAALLVVLALTPSLSTRAEVEEGQWLAEYYANPNLGGDVGLEETIEGPFLNETWDPGASPGVGLPENEFSVRFTTEYTFECANYDFRLSADDGARLY